MRSWFVQRSTLTNVEITVDHTELRYAPLSSGIWFILSHLLYSVAAAPQNALLLICIGRDIPTVRYRCGLTDVNEFQAAVRNYLWALSPSAENGGHKCSTVWQRPFSPRFSRSPPAATEDTERLTFCWKDLTETPHSPTIAKRITNTDCATRYTLLKSHGRHEEEPHQSNQAKQSEEVEGKRPRNGGALHIEPV